LDDKLGRGNVGAQIEKGTTSGLSTQANVWRMKWFAFSSILTIFVLAPSVIWATDSPSEGPTGVEESESVLHKSGYRAKDRGFNGPSSVRAQLEEDDELKDPVVRFPQIDRALQPWVDFKQWVNQGIGLQFGFDYTTLFLWLNDSQTNEDQARMGVFRAYGSWGLIGRGTEHPGNLVFKVDHRHTIDSFLAPAALGSQAGYIGQTGTLFSEVDWVLVDLNWQQAFNDRNSGIILGRYDPNDYMGILGYVNPWTTFTNLSTLLNASVAFPDASLGIGGGHWLNDQWYVKGTINDANGVVTRVDWFEGGSEFFKWGEVGWSPTKEERYTRNVHLVLWDVDERKDANIDSAQGIMVAANWTTDDKHWMGFVRGGWSDGDSPIYDETYTVGFLRKFRRNSDLLGVAVNWGEPPNDDLRSQTTGELFYRVQFAQNLAITPSLQMLHHPSLNPDKETVWVFGLRMRLTL
jgi:porin